MSAAPRGPERRVVDFWFDFGSPYSYLSAARIEPLARAHGLQVRWRPFLLGPLFRSLGWGGSPFEQQPRKLAYMWRDVARRAAKYGIGFARPSVFPRRALMLTRIAVMNADAGWLPAYCRTAFEHNFVCDDELEAPDLVRRILAAVAPGEDCEAILGRADEPGIKAATRTRTAEADALGLFGAPTFAVGPELFWGDDRLEDALIHAGGDRS